MPALCSSSSHSLREAAKSNRGTVLLQAPATLHSTVLLKAPATPLSLMLLQAPDTLLSTVLLNLRATLLGTVVLQAPATLLSTTPSAAFSNFKTVFCCQEKRANVFATLITSQTIKNFRITPQLGHVFVARTYYNTFNDLFLEFTLPRFTDYTISQSYFNWVALKKKEKILYQVFQSTQLEKKIPKTSKYNSFRIDDWKLRWFTQ